MRVIISYDITNNKLRTKFNKFICQYAHRLQYSVYEMENGTKFLNNVLLDIDNIFKKKFSQEDSIYIFKLSEGCDIIRYGYAKNEEQDYFLI